MYLEILYITICSVQFNSFTKKWVTADWVNGRLTWKTMDYHTLDIFEALFTTYRGTIGTRATLLSGRSWGSNSTHLTSATSRSGITTVSFGSFFASQSRGSGWSRVALFVQ